MNWKWTLCLILTAGPILAGQVRRYGPNGSVMVAAISRDDSSLSGGISSGSLSASGKINVEILAYLSPGGQWTNHPCGRSNLKRCAAFARGYLAESHDYVVVSSEGRGATVHASPVTLDECYGFSGGGTYEGTPIEGNAIAADEAKIFAVGSSATRLAGLEAEQIRASLRPLLTSKLDSLEALKFFSVRLEASKLIVVQRAFQDYANAPGFDSAQDHFKYIFAIGAMQGGRFQLLHWKDNIEDDNEQVLGVIRLKSGRDFLITTTSDPEGHHFRVYGIRNEKPVLVFEGGGSSC